jgi:hypothetical protein
VPKEMGGYSTSNSCANLSTGSPSRNAVAGIGLGTDGASRGPGLLHSPPQKGPGRHGHAADTGCMAKKPEPLKPTWWSVYKIASKGVWLGEVEAPDEAAAMEKGCRGIQGAGRQADGGQAMIRWE